MSSEAGTPDRSLVLATRNPHKLREMQRLFEPAGITVEPMPEDVELPPEDGLTFADNALPKALAAAGATARAAISDDSGTTAPTRGSRAGVSSSPTAAPARCPTEPRRS